MKLSNFKPEWMHVVESPRDPVLSLLESCREFDGKKEKLKKKLKDVIATLNYDRPEAILLKHKHFAMSPRSIGQ